MTEEKKQEENAQMENFVMVLGKIIAKVNVSDIERRYFEEVNPSSLTTDMRHVLSILNGAPSWDATVRSLVIKSL